MTTGGVAPDEATFRRLARQRRVVPVTRRLLGDAETPVGVYRKLAGGPGSFLLESAEHGRVWSRYSFVGVRTFATLTGTTWQGTPPPGMPADADPLTMLRAAVAALRAP